jgi:hypothetical protein
MLTINALKQIESGNLHQEAAKKQTDAIMAQLRENSSKQRAVISSSALLILAGVFATQSLWIFAGVSSALSFLFWLRSL